jgi:hypothetical protein
LAKITNPVRFSDHFGFEESRLTAAGILNTALNVDTRLFIDPLLLEHSSHGEICKGAKSSYDQHFTLVIKLLRASKSEGDVAWRNAFRLLSFPEIKCTCLGYGGQSVAGSGSGDEMTEQVIKTAKDIVDLGIEDPDLFVAMALFEDNFGPDRISDMATNVILGDLLKLNARILTNLPVPTEQLTLRLKNGKTYDAVLPINPYGNGKSPIILVPTDILRDLPVTKDWSDVADAAAQNTELRNRVNDQIAKLWTAKTLKDKEELRSWALSGFDPFDAFLQMVHGASTAPYDIEGDPQGEVFWRKLITVIAEQQPFTLETPAHLDVDGVGNVVEQIIEQFRFLIEERRLSEELYYAGKPRPEKAAQRLFFAIAYAYCKANNLDITPEADTGRGPVDFKVASGFTGRVLVEIKLSTNGKLVKGYTRQLETYKAAEQTMKGYYVVLDVGNLGEKANALSVAKNEAASRHEVTSPIVFIDGSRRPSASKL